MASVHNSTTGLIAFCATVALLCASCATGAVQETEQASPKKRSQILASLGTHALFRGAYAQAITDLRSAIDLDDKNIGAHNNLGLAYWQLGKKDLAKTEFRRALEINPNDADANINLGTAMVEENDPRTARRYYQAAADNLEYKKRHRALTNLAEIALRENKIDEARQLLYQSVQINSEYCMSHFLLGSIFMRDGNARAAADEFKKSVRSTCIDNVEAHYQLGLAYMKGKEYDKARTAFARLIETHPQTKQAQLAGDQLKSLP